MSGFIGFLGCALVVQFFVAVAIEVVKDLFADHRRALVKPLGLPTSLTLITKTLGGKVLHWGSIVHGVAVNLRRRLQGKHNERLQRFGPVLPGKPTRLVLFVRGTYGSFGYDKRWEKVADRIRTIHPAATFFRFNWVGRNSETARRADGAALLGEVELLALRYPGIPIIAIGHSHGGSVIEHATRTLSDRVNFFPITIGAPELEYVAKAIDLPDAKLTALLYAGVLTIPAFAVVLLSWCLAFFGGSTLMEWTADWILPIGFPIMVAVFLIRPLVWRARARLSTPLPPSRHCITRIWCKDDEVFGLFQRMNAIRLALDPLRDAFSERLEFLRREPWLRMIVWELVIAALCWYFIAWSIEELARSDPAKLHPFVRQPGALQSYTMFGAALMLKLLLHWRPRMYRAIASMTSLAMFAMNVGLAHLCRVSLAGLSFTEGILVEVLFHQPMDDGAQHREVVSTVKPNWFMTLHGESLADEKVLEELLKHM